MKDFKPDYGLIFDDERVDYADDAYSVALEHLVSTGNVSIPRLRMVDRYARAYAEYLWMYPDVVDEGGAIQLGPNGGDVFNMKWTVIEKLNDRIAKFELKLGMDVDKAEPPTNRPSTRTAADDYLDG